MAKCGKHTTQPSGEPLNQPEVPKGEPRVDLGEEDMDPEAMRNLIVAMQVDIY